MSYDKSDRPVNLTLEEMTYLVRLLDRYLNFRSAQATDPDSTNPLVRVLHKVRKEERSLKEALAKYDEARGWNVNNGRKG